MRSVTGTRAQKGIAVSAGRSWEMVVLLLVLMPLLEWIGISSSRWTGMIPSAAAAWAGLLVADTLLLALLWGRFKTEFRAKLGSPKLRDVGLLVLAFFTGWMVVPMTQFAAAPLAGLTPLVGGPGTDLVPDGGLDIVLLAAAAAAGGLAQEGLYRGILWDRVTAITGNEWVTVAVSSVLFGSLFWYAGLPTLLSVGVAWGLVASVLYKFTRNLSIVMVLNGLNVFMTYAVLFRYWM